MKIILFHYLMIKINIDYLKVPIKCTKIDRFNNQMNTKMIIFDRFYQDKI